MALPVAGSYELPANLRGKWRHSVQPCDRSKGSFGFFKKEDPRGSLRTLPFGRHWAEDPWKWKRVVHTVVKNSGQKVMDPILETGN